MAIETNDEVEDFLAHYGVRGMRWGVSRNRNRPGGADGKGNTPGPSRRESRAAAKAEVKALKRKNTDKIDKTIDDARKKISKSEERFAKAKTDYKSNKKTMGKAAAKQILRGERAERNITQLKNAELAQMTKSGKETTQVVLLVAGALVLSGISGGLQAYNS